MAANKEPIYVGVIIGKITELSGTTETVVFQGDPTESSRLDTLAVATDDTADKDLIIKATDGTLTKQLAIVKIPLSSGNTNALPALDILKASVMAAHVNYDANGKAFMNLPAGWSIKAQEAAAPTSGKKMWVTAKGGKY